LPLSIDALQRAVLQQLRASLELSDADSDIVLEGMPHPSAGEQFVGVWEGAWDVDPRGSNRGAYLFEIYGINVTVTRRIGFSPLDRIAPEVLIKQKKGLNAACRSILIAVHMNYLQILDIANIDIEQEQGIPIEGFVEPLRFQSAGRAELKGPDWFSASAELDAEGYGMVGLARTMAFGGAKRNQRLDAPMT
jgi:hypothetical protein